MTVETAVGLVATGRTERGTRFSASIVKLLEEPEIHLSHVSKLRFVCPGHDVMAMKPPVPSRAREERPQPAPSPLP